MLNLFARSSFGVFYISSTHTFLCQFDSVWTGAANSNKYNNKCNETTKIRSSFVFFPRFASSILNAHRIVQFHFRLIWKLNVSYILALCCWRWCWLLGIQVAQVQFVVFVLCELESIFVIGSRLIAKCYRCTDWVLHFITQSTSREIVTSHVP